MKTQELKDIVSGASFNGEVRFMEPMKNHTSLRIGGTADIFIIPQDLDSFRSLHIYLRNNMFSFFPLGGGTNILVRDGGMEEIVLSFRSFNKIEVLSEDDNFLKVSVEAGTPLQKLVQFSQERGWSGLEGFVGIPGTVGGAICGNAGAFGYEIKDVLISVVIMDFNSEIKHCKTGELKFGYRSSQILSDGVILSAEILLKKDRKEEVIKRSEKFLSTKRESQPLWELSAGCVFKNPPDISAGKLIEEAGCKSMRIGDIEVSSIHANFFINKGNATSSNFVRLMDEVALRVNKQFKIILEPEIKIVGRDIANG